MQQSLSIALKNNSFAILTNPWLSISITSKPKLAWKIIWALQLLPFLFFLLVYEITGKNLFSGNIWFNWAKGASLVTAAIISKFMIDEEN
jgi:hypothetical protein